MFECVFIRKNAPKPRKKGTIRYLMKSYTHVIWDFNGTLLDDVLACIDSANQLLAAHNLPLLKSTEEYRSKFGFPIIDYYRRLGFDFETLPYADLAVEWVAYYLENSRSSAVLYPDVTQALGRLRDMGISQLILSATERTMLENQVATLGIRPYFETLLGLDNIHAYSKEEIGMRWRQENPNARVLLIGDTEHDAQVAAAIGADYVLVARGHQSRETLESCQPLLVADTLKELERVL